MLQIIAVPTTEEQKYLALKATGNLATEGKKGKKERKLAKFQNYY